MQPRAPGGEEKLLEKGAHSPRSHWKTAAALCVRSHHWQKVEKAARASFSYLLCRYVSLCAQQRHLFGPLRSDSSNGEEDGKICAERIRGRKKTSESAAERRNMGSAGEMSLIHLARLLQRTPCARSSLLFSFTLCTSVFARALMPSL